MISDAPQCLAWPKGGSVWWNFRASAASGWRRTHGSSTRPTGPLLTCVTGARSRSSEAPPLRKRRQLVDPALVLESTMTAVEAVAELDRYFGFLQVVVRL